MSVHPHDRRSFLSLMLTSPFWGSTLMAVAAAPSEVPITKFGAKADGATLNTKAIQAAIDRCAADGGGVVVVLEREEEVDRRGIAPYCELAGWGQASDGYNVAISHPEGTGSRVAMENALAATGIAAAEVDYVNAHATSTLIGDVSEARAL